MRIVIGNAIEVFEPTQVLLDFCYNNLVIDNPEYLSRLRMGKWVGDVPKKLFLYERRGEYLRIPYGCRRKVLELIKSSEPLVWAEYPEIHRVDYKSNISLYDYQLSAVKSMSDFKNGIVVMPCGSGKTQTALELVASLGLKTLWLTHTQDLLHQSMERAKSCFDCDADMFGTITAGKVNISEGITFATVQTMCKLDLSQYRTDWQVVIVDECQHCCGSPTRVTQFYKVVNSLYAPYKFGLTATPRRTDGLDKSMYALLGGIIFEVNSSVVSDRTCEVRIETIDSKFSPNLDNVLNGDGTINYSCLISELINDQKRFEYLSFVINNTCKKCSMVLANRVQYLERLSRAYGGKSICISTLGASKKAKEERKEALRKLNAGEIDCIFATYQLAAEGLDCPNLRYVVFATPEKNERTVTQAVGRVARKADGKAYGTVIDFVDDFGIYKGWQKKRAGYYKKMGFDLI